MVGFSLVKKVILSLRVSSFTFIWTEIYIKCYPCQMLFFYLKALYFIISKYLHFLFNQWFDWFAACKDRKLNKIAFEQNLSISWKTRKTKKLTFLKRVLFCDWTLSFHFYLSLDKHQTCSCSFEPLQAGVAQADSSSGTSLAHWHKEFQPHLQMPYFKKYFKLYINPHQVDSLLD